MALALRCRLDRLYLSHIREIQQVKMQQVQEKKSLTDTDSLMSAGMNDLW